ncbi:hypothetical protein E4U52_000958 [Claviceps spartinae]|nr:hypothetical protein E4U52_000958 [Claviceps spartinae]
MSKEILQNVDAARAFELTNGVPTSGTGDSISAAFHFDLTFARRVSDFHRQNGWIDEEVAVRHNVAHPCRSPDDRFCIMQTLSDASTTASTRKA